MPDITNPSLDYTDLQYCVHDPNIGCARSHGWYLARSHWDLVKSQCWILPTQVWITQIHNTVCMIPILDVQGLMVGI